MSRTAIAQGFDATPDLTSAHAVAERTHFIQDEAAMVTGNVFAKVPQQLADEAVEELLSAPNVRIERIVSMGHATAADEWYDQGRAECVLLLAGVRVSPTLARSMQELA